MLSQMSDREKTAYITEKLGDLHSPLEWVYLQELRIGGGYGKDSEQRLDGFAIAYAPSKQNRAIVYEVKVSRSDFMSEIKKPIKRRRGLAYSNEFYFVCPQGMVKVEEVPPECGLIEVSEQGDLLITTKAPFRDTFPLPRNFIASVLRRLDRERLYNFLKQMDEDTWVKETGNVVLGVLADHIDRWANYTQGSKEIPDKIAAALRDVRNDVLQEMINKKLMR